MKQCVFFKLVIYSKIHRNAIYKYKLLWSVNFKNVFPINKTLKLSTTYTSFKLVLGYFTSTKDCIINIENIQSVLWS